MKKLNETLKKLLEEQHKTQKQLADYLNFSKGAINQWCKGPNEPSIDSLIKIARFFNVSINYLLTGEEVDEENIIVKKEKYNKIIKVAQELLDVIKED